MTKRIGVKFGRIGFFGAIVLASGISGCSGNSGAAGNADVSSTFVLSSTAVTTGGTIPAEYTCASGSGPKPSPPLAWTEGPAGTMGYAIVLQDESNKWTHWAIWDIPSTVMSLPRDVSQATHLPADPVGARQVGGDNDSLGYIPPCPPSGEHDYVFTVYAQKALPLTGVTTDQFAGDIKARLDKSANNLGTARLATKVAK